MAGVITVEPKDDGGDPHQHTTLTIDGEEDRKTAATTEESDPWAAKRVTRSEESTQPIEIGGDAEAGEPEKVVTLPYDEASLPNPKVTTRATPPPSKPELIDVVLETDQYSVELQVLGVEVNRPFLILIHGEKPNFSPKGRCKFLAKIGDAQYSVDFLGIQFQIKSHGLHITTFLFDDRQSGPEAGAP